MKHTVIGVYDRSAEARQAAKALTDQGFAPSAVHVTHETGGDEEIPQVPAAVEVEGGPVSGLLHRLAVLFNVEEPHVAHYAEAVRRGGTVVTVDAADEAQATRARDTLLRTGAVKFEDRVEEWQRSGWQAAAGATASSPRPAAVAYHRQEVSIGGVRVYGRASVAVFEDAEHEFRRDHAERHAAEGSYEDFDPAYRYGHGMAGDPRYGGRSWDDIESSARDDWQHRYPHSAWERSKAAVRRAWERFTRA